MFLVSSPTTELEMSSARRHNRLRVKNATFTEQSNGTHYGSRNPIKFDVPIVPDLSFLSSTKDLTKSNKQENYYCNSGCVSDYGGESNYSQLLNEELDNDSTSNKCLYNLKYATLGRITNNANFDENQHLTLSRGELISKSFSGQKNFNFNFNFENKKSSNCGKQLNELEKNEKDFKLAELNNNRRSLLTSASVKFPSASSFSSESLINKYNTEYPLDDSISLKSQRSQYSNCSSISSSNLTNQTAPCYNNLVNENFSATELNANDRFASNLRPLMRTISNVVDNNKKTYCKSLSQIQPEKYLPYVPPRILDANTNQNAPIANIYFNRQGQNLKQKNELNADGNFSQKIAANNNNKDKNFSLKSSLSVSTLLSSSLAICSTSTPITAFLHTENKTNYTDKSQNTYTDVKNIVKYNNNNKTYKNTQGDSNNDIDRFNAKDFSAEFDGAKNCQGECDVGKSANINTLNKCNISIMQNDCKDAYSTENIERALNAETRQKNNNNFNNNNQTSDKNALDCCQIDQHWNLKSEKGMKYKFI